MQTGARTALRSERLADRPLAFPAKGHRQPEALDVAFGLLERDRLHPFAVLQLDCGPPIGRPQYALAHTRACLVEPHLDAAVGTQVSTLPLPLASLVLALVDVADSPLADRSMPRPSLLSAFHSPS